MKNLEGYVLQINNYFTIRVTCNEEQQLSYVGLRTEGKALEWWKANRYMYTTGEEVEDAISEYYGDHYKMDGDFNEI